MSIMDGEVPAGKGKIMVTNPYSHPLRVAHLNPRKPNPLTLEPDAAARARIAEALCRALWPLVEAGAVRPLIDSTYALDEAVAAHRHMESSTHVGKILLQVAPED